MEHAEKLLCLVWYHGLLPHPLQTLDQRTLQVWFRGTWNLSDGPDFQGARLSLTRPDAATEPEILGGDIELHARASDWFRHRHHVDVKYNRVLLHVVAEQDLEEPFVLTQGGTPVPHLCLASAFLSQHLPLIQEDIPLEVTQAPPLSEGLCHQALKAHLPVMNKENLSTALQSFGISRLERKVERFRKEVDALGWEQAFYQAFLESLGFPHNRPGFLELARRAPLSQLREWVRSHPGSSPQEVEFFLLYKAGILPGEKSPAPERMDRETSDYLSQAKTWLDQQPLETFKEVLPEGTWNHRRVFPLSFPERRLAGAARFLYRSLHQPFFPALAASLKPFLYPSFQFSPSPSAQKYKSASPQGTSGIEAQTFLSALAPFFMDSFPPSSSQTPESYWHRRATLGGKPWPKPKALLGNQEIQIISYNVFLPFLILFFEKKGWTGTSEGAPLEGEFQGQDVQGFLSKLVHFEVVPHFPRLPLHGPSRSALQRMFYGDARPRGFPRTETEHQGLLYLFNHYCFNGVEGCRICPLLEREPLEGEMDEGPLVEVEHPPLAE